MLRSSADRRLCIPCTYAKKWSLTESIFSSGDAEALSTLQRLLATSSKPYFEMLEAWLCEGVLNDPYAEFMIREDKVNLLYRSILRFCAWQESTFDSKEGNSELSVNHPRLCILYKIINGQAYTYYQNILVFGTSY